MTIAQGLSRAQIIHVGIIDIITSDINYNTLSIIEKTVIRFQIADVVRNEFMDNKIIFKIGLLIGNDKRFKHLVEKITTFINSLAK